MLRTAFLFYVRVILCLQGMYLAFQAWENFYHRTPDDRFWVELAFALIVSLLGLAVIVTAVRLRRGRRGVAIAAILIEALWAAAAALLGYVGWIGGTPALALLLFALAVLFLVAAVGLLLRPVRAYAGLVRP